MEAIIPLIAGILMPPKQQAQTVIPQKADNTPIILAGGFLVFCILIVVFVTVVLKK